MKGLDVQHPDLALHGRCRKQLHIIALVAWYTARKQDGMGLHVVSDELDDLLSIGNGKGMNCQSSGVAVDTTGEPICQ